MQTRIQAVQYDENTIIDVHGQIWKRYKNVYSTPDEIRNVKDFDLLSLSEYILLVSKMLEQQVKKQNNNNNNGDQQ